MKDTHNEDPTEGAPPSFTNAQCKVCASPDRFEIEVCSLKVSRRRQSHGAFRETVKRSADKTSTQITDAICR